MTFSHSTGLPGNKLAQVWHFAHLDNGRSVMGVLWMFCLFLQKLSYIVYGAIKNFHFSSHFFNSQTKLEQRISVALAKVRYH